MRRQLLSYRTTVIVEEEYFIEGTANQYTNPEFENAEVIDSGHRYRTRLIVRRPQAAQFNGIVIVEWINVTRWSG